MILVALLYALLASTFIFAKKALLYANPFFLIGVRMLLAGMIMLVYQYVTNKKALSIKRSDLFLFFKAAIFHIYLSFILEFWALQYLTALKTTVIYSATPFVAALLSYFLLNERLSLKKITGIIIGLGGLLPVLIAQAGSSNEFSGLWKISLPEIVLFGAVISGSYAWFIVSNLMKKGYSLGTINGFSMLVGGAMSFGTSLIVEGVRQPINDFYPFLGWLLLLIFVANIVVYNFYGWLLKRYSITFVTFSGFLCPSFGTLYEWLFLGGSITWHYLASLALVTGGLYLFYQEELKVDLKKRYKTFREMV